MEIIKIESSHDCKIITCRCDIYSNYGKGCTEYPKTLHFLGDLYVKTGYNSDKNEVYYKASRTPVPFN